MRIRPLLSASLLLLLTTGMEPARATDEALLQVLLQNKLITQPQYDAIVKAQNSTASKPLPAQDQGLLDVLLANNVITQEQYAALQVKNADDKAKKTQETAVTNAQKFTITSGDKNFNWHVGGRVLFDWTNADNSTGKIGAGTRTSPIVRTTTNFEDKAAFRQLRLQVEGTVYKDWFMKIQYDFADTTGNNVSSGIRDAYIRYNTNLADNPGWLQVGHFNEYMTLERITAATDTTFIERSQMAQAFDASNGHLVGAGTAFVWKDLFLTQVGAFGRELGASNPSTTDALRVTGRGVLAPWHTSDRVLHLGGAFSWISDFDNRAFAPNPRPEFDTDSTGTRPFGSFYAPLIGTAAGGGFTTIPIANTTTGALVNCINAVAVMPAGCATGGWRYGAEAAFVYGPWSLQGEWQQYDIDRSAGTGQVSAAASAINAKSLSFYSWYIFGSWIITGESRGYDLAEGKFKNPKPLKLFGKGGWGAWELAARYSELSLYDKDLNTCTLTSVAGSSGLNNTMTGGKTFNNCGEEDMVTVGLNWYPNEYIKFMANYVDVVDFRHGRFDGMTPSAFILRAQAYF
jgi:phosphate-selective porin OprO/OprP